MNKLDEFKLNSGGCGVVFSDVLRYLSPEDRLKEYRAKLRHIVWKEEDDLRIKAGKFYNFKRKSTT